MHETFFTNERSHSPEAYPNASMNEIANDLATQLKLSFANLEQELAKDDLELATKLASADDADELSVEVYTHKNDIISRMADLKDIAAEGRLPKDVALLVIRLPSPFDYIHYRDDAYNPIAKAARRLTSELWTQRDQYISTRNVDIERINPKFDHDDTRMSGYYYLWLITPMGKMPAELLPSTPENTYDAY